MPSFMIKPYRIADGTWVFDDAAVGLQAEAFVWGMSEMLDSLIAAEHIESDPVLNFTDERPIDYQPTATLTWEAGLAGGNWYSSTIAGQRMIGWLCPSLFKYFNKAPKQIYVTAV